MLIDIFARRYDEFQLRNTFEDRDRRLLIQAFRILAEDLSPYYLGGKEDSKSVNFWTSLESGLSRELGIKALSPKWSSYNANGYVQASKNTLLKVCETWLSQPVSGSPDIYIKERLSLIELGFRAKETEIEAENRKAISETEKLIASLKSTGPRVRGDPEDAARSLRARRLSVFQDATAELNTRFRQAKYPLNYHNGFIQIATDDFVQDQIETPFWSLLSDSKWQNVDTDMKEALDLRDSDGRDPAFYAARALESTIKVISDTKKWTHGGEKGAHNYIDNLGSKKNTFLAPWECALIKDFFTHIRNPLGHGAGSSTMPSLTKQQTEWAIEFSMSWIKSLIMRL
ncbi:AbiJ-NTD4 domain-containing protein [Coralliovum pocilloporae]|uniref:AbiJ-NTD4 domain-containing protein n=1 Tax=Coralliovum pocilloporae TaxID=3066369 RepID=UPI003307A90A